jgi:hypothetical protein
VIIEHGKYESLDPFLKERQLLDARAYSPEQFAEKLVVTYVQLELAGDTHDPFESLMTAAEEYEGLRSRMSPSPSRTGKMTRIVQDIRNQVNWRSFKPGEIRTLIDGFESAADGVRIVTLALLQSMPRDTGMVAVTLSAIGKSRSAFEQFNGLLLAESLIPLLDAKHAQELREVLEGQIGNTITQRDSSRWFPATQMIQRLSSQIS